MSHDVFISYSHTDKMFADTVCNKLESSDIRCWVAPRDIHPSEDWAEAIINAMDASAILLLVFSSSSNNSAQVRREVERAVSKGLIILTLRIEDVSLCKSLEYFISAQHWLDMFTGDMEENLLQLCDCVVLLLERLISAQDAAPYAAPAALKSALSPKQEPIQHAEVVSQISPEILSSVGDLLAQVLGPIAKHLVKRSATADMTPAELISTLSQEIDNELERKQFVARCTAVI